MKIVWKVAFVLVGVVILEIITLPLWRYEVSERADYLTRYDRLTGEVQVWNDGHWQKYQ